jgi:two-component system, OmpR family, response regulator
LFPKLIEMNDRVPVAAKETPPLAASLLVVEDDDAIRELLASALRFAGYQTEAVSSGTDGYSIAITKRFDLLILDVGLPGIDGFELCRLLRERGDYTPVIFLTARRELDDMRTGYEGGGDDYLTKPFSLQELTMRVNAVLRRSVVGRNGPTTQPAVALRCGDLVVKEDQHRVVHGERIVQLTPTEFRVLTYLIHNQGVVLSKDQILENVWGYDFEGDVRIVETYVSSIRTKLNPDGVAAICTVRGFGYVLRAGEQ